MTAYQSVQVSPDGQDYITDHRAATVSDVWEAVNDQGSRWYFYPIPFVITATGGPIMRKRRTDSSTCAAAPSEPPCSTSPTTPPTLEEMMT